MLPAAIVEYHCNPMVNGKNEKQLIEPRCSCQYGDTYLPKQQVYNQNFENGVQRPVVDTPPIGVKSNTSETYRENDISYIDGMDGHDFEHFCADLLRKNGFIGVSVTPRPGDQGVDILAEKDSVKYAIQCKNYASPLGNTPVQEVHAGKTFYGCHVGVVMTNSTFTSGAIDLAKATGILLWDRTVMQEMIIKGSM